MLALHGRLGGNAASELWGPLAPDPAGGERSCSQGLGKPRGTESPGTVVGSLWAESVQAGEQTVSPLFLWAGPCACACVHVCLCACVLCVTLGSCTCLHVFLCALTHACTQARVRVCRTTVTPVNWESLRKNCILCSGICALGAPEPILTGGTFRPGHGESRCVRRSESGGPHGAPFAPPGVSAAFR